MIRKRSGFGLKYPCLVAHKVQKKQQQAFVKH